MSYAVTLELYARGPATVTFDSIETGLSMTMSREVFEDQGQPDTLTVVVAELSEPAALSHDAKEIAS